MTRRQIVSDELTVFTAYGTYTPTLTNGTNVAASTAYVCQYARVGNLVTVSGNVSIDATAAGTTSLRCSLPIASNLAATQNLGGAMNNSLGDSGNITGDLTNDEATMTTAIADTSNRLWGFIFAYRVI